MKLLKVRNYCGIISMSALLCSCSSTAVFPEIIEETPAADTSAESSFTTKKGTRIEMSLPEESSSLTADDKNAAYEGEEEEDKELDDAMNNDDLTSSDNKEDVTPPKKAENVEIPETLSEASDNLSEEESIIEPTVMTADDGTPSVSYRMDTFYFANGSSILDSKYNAKIRKIVKEAKAKNATVKVLGFASSRTRNTDIVSHKLANFKVSSERADSVARALRRYGLAADKIETEALSDSAPAYQEVMPEGERLNRRVEVYITY